MKGHFFKAIFAKSRRRRVKWQFLGIMVTTDIMVIMVIMATTDTMGIMDIMATTRAAQRRRCSARPLR